MNEFAKEPLHFVLIHGACLGAWSWYKVTTHLKMAGHKVTALDMAASGIDKRSIQNIRTVKEYSQPLLDFMKQLPSDRKVILVGHSFGGINISLAMEHYPEKVSVVVFLTAFMPDIVNPCSHVLQQYLARIPPANWLDSIFTTQETPTDSPTILSFGPEFAKRKGSQLSPVEDYELSMVLLRPGSMYINDPSSDKKFRAEGYGSVKRVYIICEEDLVIPKDFQKWMITNYESTTKEENIDTFIIPNADHTPMFSQPKKVVKCLLDVAQKIQLRSNKKFQ